MRASLWKKQLEKASKETPALPMKETYEEVLAFAETHARFLGDTKMLAKVRFLQARQGMGDTSEA